MNYDKKITPEELESQIEPYSKDCEDKKLPKTIIGFVNFIGICKNTFYEYAKQQDYKKICNRVQAKCEQDTLEMGLTGKYQPHIAKLILNGYGYYEKKEIDQHLSGSININRIIIDDLDDEDEEEKE